MAAHHTPPLILAALLAACSSEVWDHTTTSGATEGSSSSSSGTGGSASSSSGTGGGPKCSASQLAGCVCPDEPGAAWARTFNEPSGLEAIVPWMAGTLPIASDGSTVLLLATDVFDENAGAFDQRPTRFVKLDAAGQILWDQPTDGIASPTPDPNGCSTVVTGAIELGTTQVLGHMVSCSTAHCPFAARLDAGGAPVWIKVFDFGGDAWTAPQIAGVLADGRIALVGPFHQGSVDLGNGPLSAPQSGVFVAMLSPSGDALWSRHLAKEQWTPAFAVAVLSAAGDITVATRPGGAVDFGDGPVPEPGASVPGGLVLASYDPSGALRFGNIVASPSPMLGCVLARDAAGDLILGVHTYGSADFGGGPLSDDAGETLSAVVVFDAEGNHLWDTVVGDLPLSALAADAAHHVWVGGGNDGLIELGPSGALIATHPFSGQGTRFASAIGFTPSGSPVIAGGFKGTIDLGQGPLVALGSRDTFVAKLAP